MGSDPTIKPHFQKIEHISSTGKGVVSRSLSPGHARALSAVLGGTTLNGSNVHVIILYLERRQGSTTISVILWGKKPSET